MPTISLHGRVAVVSGAGGGLGRAHARELARRGAAVVVNARHPGAGPSGPGAEAVVEEIRAAGGRAVAAIESVATQEGAAAVIDKAMTQFGDIDIVVHNAGTWRNMPFEQMTSEHLDAVLDVHLKGAFYLVRPAWLRMSEKGYGRIVLTSSPAGVFGRPNGANYAAAKAGLVGLGRALAVEGAARGIKVNCIMPLAATETNPRERVEAGRKEPERVSPLVAYLCSSACAISGHSFSAGIGGHVAQIFTGVTSGWWTGVSFPTAEDIADHLAHIEDRSRYTVPDSSPEFMAAVDVVHVRGSGS